MGISPLEKRIYELKNAVVSHTGPAGRAAEKAIAKRWIDGITAAVDQAQEDPSLLRRQSISPKAFREMAARTSQPMIAQVIYGFAIGGGEIFPIHLTNALQKAGAPVLLICCGMTEEDPKVRGLVDEDVPVVLLDTYAKLPQALEAYGIQIVHTHHAAIDLAVSRAIETGKITARQVVTLHGMYEALDAPRRQMLCEQVIKTVSCFAYIADKNLTPFKEIGKRVACVKVPNGLPAGVKQVVKRESLGIPEDAFVLCLVSRARPEKGWKEAIDTVNLANEMHPLREVHLILVGDGEAYDQQIGRASRTIHFVGAQQDTRQYIAAADMGFLPSRYAGESFPLVLIDSFMCGRPVMATALGEVPAMVAAGKGAAGYICDLTDEGQVPVKKLAKAILRLQEEPHHYDRMKGYTRECALRYDISVVADRYMLIYQDVQKGLPYSQFAQESPFREASDPDTQILISCHKHSRTPNTDILRPIQVGSALTKKRFPGMLHDDEGDSISDKNRSYCEMTAQYWAWKHVDADIYGFFHYRRYLNLSDKTCREDRYGNVYEPVYTDKLIKKYGWDEANIRELMRYFDVITVKPQPCQDAAGKPISVYEQYAAAPYLKGEDLQLAAQLTKTMFPQYAEAADRYLNGQEAYFCNLFICRAELFKAYASWVFPVLEAFCKQRDMSGYDAQQLRTPGHIAERLWGVFVTYLEMQGTYEIRKAQSVVVSKTEHIRPADHFTPVNALKKTVHAVVER